MSQVPSKIGLMPQNIQISYNRLLVQIGLAAFRNGLYNEAFITLNDILNLLRRAR